MIRFEILGQIALHDGAGIPITSVLAQPKRTALLAVLALKGGRAIQREALVELLWPELPPERGRAALRKGVHFLRQALGPGTIVTIGSELAADPQRLHCDAVEFERLAAGDPAAALAIYRGDLLPGLVVEQAPEFGPWLDARESGLRRLAADVAARALARAQADGRSADAWTYARRWLEIDPVDGAALRRILEVGEWTGERLRALREYQVHKELMAARYELEPAPSVAAFAAELAAGLADHRESRVARSTGPATGSPPAVPPGRTDTAAAASDVPAAHDTAEDTANANRAGAVPPVPGARRRNPWPWRPLRHRAAWLATAALTVVAALALVAVVVLVDALPGRPETQGPLAVGWIRNLSPADSAVAAVIPELLATNLARADGLDLIGTRRLAELMDPSAERGAALAGAARRAGAADLVEGALLQRPEGGYQLELRRIDARSGAVRRVYRVQGGDVFELVDAATTALLLDVVGAAPELRVADAATTSLVALRFYQEGVKHYMRGRTAWSRPLFAAALEEDSTFAMAAYYLAVTGEHFDEAQLERALRLSRNAPDAERLMIESIWLQHMDDPRRTVAAERLVARFPRDPASWMLLGRAQHWGGDFAGAAVTLRHVIAADSATPPSRVDSCRACDAHFDLATLFLHVDSGVAAERLARAYLKRNPGSDRGWDMLANALEHQGRYAETLDALARFAEHSGQHDLAHARRAVVAMRQGDFAKADSLLAVSPAQREAGSEPLFLWYRVISLRNQGRFTEALQLAREYELAERQRGHAEPVMLAVPRGTVLFEAGRFREAAELFHRIADAPPSAPDSRRSRHRAWNLTHAATAWAALGDTARLRTLADSIQALGSRSGYGRDQRLHHHVRGLDAALRGDTAAAIAHLRRAVFSLTHGYTRTNYELGRLLLDTGRAPEAVAVLEPALRGTVSSSQLYLTHRDVHAQLARAYRSLDQPARAASHETFGRRYGTDSVAAIPDPHTGVPGPLLGH